MYVYGVKQKKSNVSIDVVFILIHVIYKHNIHIQQVWNKRKGDGKCDCIPMLTCHCLLLGASPLDRVGFAFNSIYSNNLINYLYTMHCT